MCIRDSTEGFSLRAGADNTAVLDYALQNEVACFTGEPQASAAAFRLQAGESADFTVANAPAKLVPVSYTHLDVYKRQP